VVMVRMSEAVDKNVGRRRLSIKVREGKDEIPLIESRRPKSENSRQVEFRKIDEANELLLVLERG